LLQSCQKSCQQVCQKACQKVVKKLSKISLHLVKNKKSELGGEEEEVLEEDWYSIDQVPTTSHLVITNPANQKYDSSIYFFVENIWQR
jgi:hypothetical protein